MACLLTALAGCAIFRPDDSYHAPPIENPFGRFYENGAPNPNSLVLRTKTGDRSVEVEFSGGGGLTDFVVPVGGLKTDRSVASHGQAGAMDEKYINQKPVAADREIIKSFPQGLPEDNWKRNEIESGLGLVPSEENYPESSSSYLAAVDHVKQLYVARRYEAAIIEIDKLVRLYPTDSKLFQMRGTLLERLGYHDLAMKSWTQALEFTPENEGLQKFIKRKQDQDKLRRPAQQ